MFTGFYICDIVVTTSVTNKKRDEKGMKDRSRKWLLTINNPQEHELTHENIKIQLQSIKNLNYWCMCDEVGQNGTYHTHLFIYRVDAIRFNQIKRLFPSAHIDFCRGTTQDNRDYIRKEGSYAGTLKEETNLKDTFEEFGDCPEEKQGARNDLTELYAMIKDGLTDYEILENNPNYMNKLDTIERTRQIIRFKQYEEVNRDIHVTYRFGKSGTGKSRKVLEEYGFKNVYRITDPRHPFDSYSGQDVIVFEEFYSSNWHLSDMLNYLDIYPIKLPSRYANKQACYTKVFINSNVPPDVHYSEVQKKHKDKWQAFCRRIHKVEYFKSETDIVVYNSVDEYLNREEWVPLEKYTQEQLLFY